MDTFLETFLAAFEQFINPQQTVYKAVITWFPGFEIILVGAAIVGMALVVLGTFSHSNVDLGPFFNLASAAPQLILIILLALVCGVIGTLAADSAMRSLYQALLILYVILGYTLSKIALLLGAYKLGSWSVDHKLASLLAFAAALAASIALRDRAQVMLAISALLLLGVAAAAYRFANDANLNDGLALGLAVLAAVGGLYESEFSLDTLGGGWVIFWTALRYLFLVGFFSGLVRELLARRS